MSPQQLHDRVAPTYLQATISPPFAAFEKEDSMLTNCVGCYSSPAVVIDGRPSPSSRLLQGRLSSVIVADVTPSGMAHFQPAAGSEDAELHARKQPFTKGP